MATRTLPLLLLVASIATAKGVVWKQTCDPELVPYSSALPIVCGSFSVPLDYTAADSNQTLELQLFKIPAENATKSEHSVLVNFGGPGNNGLDMFTANGSSLHLLLGEEHDIVLIEPRGTAPNFNFSCSENLTAGAVQASWTSLNGNASDAALGSLWATTDLYAEACKTSPDAAHGDLIGSAFTARDFMQVAEALDEDGLIYYQGYSYGTLLGMTIASLFPDKVGRMLLDGNVNAYDYYQNSYVDYYLDTDAVFSIFCSTCVTTSQLCRLAHNQSATDLEAELLALLEDLKYHPLPVLFPDGQGALVDYSFVTSTIYNSLYEPTTWPLLSAMLAELLAGNTTSIPEALLIPTSGPDAISSIRCSDSRVRTSDPSTLNSLINATETESPIFGGTSVSFYYTCAHWPFSAKGNFSWPAGNVTVKTKAPVMLIGNSHDPVTPLANARFNSAALQNSVVLQHKGVGHTALVAQGSLCTARAIRAYWANGTLPEAGTSCEIDVPVFSLDNGWETVLRQLAQENGENFS